MIASCSSAPDVSLLRSKSDPQALVVPFLEMLGLLMVSENRSPVDSAFEEALEIPHLKTRKKLGAYHAIRP